MIPWAHAILEVTDKVLRERKRLSFDGLQKVIHDFIHYQKMQPDPDAKKEMKALKSVEQQRSQQVMNKIIGLVRENRESL